MADTNEKNWYGVYEQRYKILNNELVIPEYNKFCEENGLKEVYEILGKIPGKNGIPKLYDLHEKALNAFNRVNKRFHYFQGKIVSFHFVTHLDFTFEEWTIEEFLEDVEKLGNTLEVTEKREKIYAYSFFGFLLFGTPWIYISIFDLVFPNVSRFPHILFFIGWIPALFFLEKFISKYHQNKKNRDIRRKLTKLKTEIEKLRNNPQSEVP